MRTLSLDGWRTFLNQLYKSWNWPKATKDKLWNCFNHMLLMYKKCKKQNKKTIAPVSVFFNVLRRFFSLQKSHQSGGDKSFTSKCITLPKNNLRLTNKFSITYMKNPNVKKIWLLNWIRTCTYIFISSRPLFQLYTLYPLYPLYTLYTMYTQPARWDHTVGLCTSLVKDGNW